MSKKLIEASLSLDAINGALAREKPVQHSKRVQGRGEPSRQRARRKKETPFAGRWAGNAIADWSNGYIIGRL